MTRTRATAKKAGAAFERVVADHLAEHLDDRIDRAVRRGALDRGDIGNVRLPTGEPLAVEVKNTTRSNLAGWAAEATAEATNLGAPASCVVHKRHGVAAPGKQWVTMTLDDLIVLLSK